MVGHLTYQITEHTCVMSERREKCGKTWYQTTVDGQTIGACSRTVTDKDGTLTVVPLGKKDLPLSVDVERKDGQTTITLLDAKHKPITAVAWTA